MSEWFTFAQILAVAQNDLPSRERSLRRFVSDAGWRNSKDQCKRQAKNKGGDLFHISLLPGPVQLRLKAASGEVLENKFEDTKPVERTRETLWEAYEQLPKHQKDECQNRLDFLVSVESQIDAGAKKQAAIAIACKKFGNSLSTYRNWALLVKPWKRADWLAALAPQYKNEIGENTCHPEAWKVLKADYLRPEKPSLSACYRRMKEVAKREEWSPVPSLRTIRRWVEKELPRAVLVMAREKGEVSKRLYPAQRRTRDHLHAMQMVNIDGHKFDVFVEYENGRVGRPMMLAIQDLYSNLFVAHRIDESENKELVRLTIGDMMERYGIPEKLVADNGRAFASKQITGGQKTRYRFKVREEEPQGLLTSMGVEVIWTTPYSGQSKPIERAFRDLCDTIARHPFCAGAYTGNTPDARPDNCKRAIPIAEFRNFVAEQMEIHNQRTDRNTQIAKGRSFRTVFEESMAKPETLVQMPTKAQQNLWLLAAEQVRAEKGSGIIELMGTRYYNPLMVEYAGQKMTVRFDPQNLAKPIKVYTAKDEFLMEAEVFADVAFDNVDAARSHNRTRRELLKATKIQERILNDMEIEKLSRIMPAPEPINDAEPKKVRRIATGNTALKAEPETDNKTNFEENFAKAMELTAGENVIPFRSSDE